MSFEGSPCSQSTESGSSRSSGEEGDCEDDHFAWHKGMVLDSRYEVLEELGRGTFGRVLLSQDRRESRQVALKVVRDTRHYVESARIEASILADVAQADLMGTSRCAVLYDSFLHDAHFCLVFEPLGASLYAIMKENGLRGFWVSDIQSMVKQCLVCLCFLHQLNVTHADLKPENVLIQTRRSPRCCVFPREEHWQRTRRSSRVRDVQYLRPASTEVKVIDFGNAMYERSSCVINTRQYRAPEVILEAGWDERSDIWSLGCVLMELYTGEQLFGTHENLEHLALMERVLGALPFEILARGKLSVQRKYLSQDARRLRWPEGASATSCERVRCHRTLAELVCNEHGSLLSLARSLLTLDPTRRPSAVESLKHRFFSETFES